MTNEDKAIQIYNLFYKQFIKDGYPDEIATTCAICGKAGAEVMAEWQYQQIIEKACEWLKDMACYYAHWECNGDTYEQEVIYDTEKLINDFKKAMEGGAE